MAAVLCIFAIWSVNRSNLEFINFKLGLCIPAWNAQVIYMQLPCFSKFVKMYWKYCWKEKLFFSTIFSAYLSLQESNYYMYSFVKCSCSLKQNWYVEVRISQSISKFEVHVTRFDCMFLCRNKKTYLIWSSMYDVPFLLQWKDLEGTNMLPFVTRNRRPGSTTTSSDVTELMSSMKRTSLRFRLMPFKAKCFFVFFIISAFFIYGSIFWFWRENSLTKEDFLGTDKCPSCYGRSLCFELFDSQLELKGLSKMRNSGCDVARTHVLTKTSQDIVKNGLQPKHFKDTSFMFICPSHKLLNRVIERYKEKTTNSVDLEHDDKLQLLFTAKVNSEPLLLQVVYRYLFN